VRVYLSVGRGVQEIAAPTRYGDVRATVSGFAFPGPVKAGYDLKTNQKI
jgi:hypothetical protein